jgi:nucleoside-diphosphate-sugar epimerase
MIDFANTKIGVSDHLYGWSKLTAERMLWQIHQTTQLQIHILRPFSGYGLGQSLLYPLPNLIHMIQIQPQNIQVWGNGQQTRDWVHINDIMRTIEWCSKDHSQYLTMNIGTGIPTSFIELVNLIHTLLYQTSCPKIQTLAHKPNGVQCRVADIQLQKQFDLVPLVTLTQGIKTFL